MWYLLLAAGVGYLSTKWHNVQKPRPLCGQNTSRRASKVLGKIEDLVSDMRKALEEKKIHLCGMDEASDEGSNDDFFTIELKNVVEGQSLGAKSNNFETNPEESNTQGMGGDEDGTQWSRHSYFKEGSGSMEEGEANSLKSAIELERRLWQVFQERQEERILELQAALHLALRKLHVKHKELCRWKNRAFLLMQQPCGAISGKLDTLEQSRRVGVFERVNNEYLRNKPRFSSGGLARTNSTCSSSSGDSVLSIDASAFTCPINKTPQSWNGCGYSSV